MAVTKTQILMFLIASLASAGLAVLLAVSVGSRDFLIISVPGWIISAFFAFKYFTYGRKSEREEQHRRNRHHRH